MVKKIISAIKKWLKIKTFWEFDCLSEWMSYDDED